MYNFFFWFFMSRRALFVLLFIVILDATAFGMVYPLFSSMLFGPEVMFVSPSTSEGVRGLFLGVLLSLPAVIQMVTAPWIGRFSDRYGRKPALLLCLGGGLFSSLCAVLSVQGNSLIGLMFARAAMGICLVSYAIVNVYIVDASDEKDRGRRIAWIHSAFGLGFAGGPFLGSVLISETIFGTVSLCRPFFITSLLIFINLLFVVFFLPETRSSREKSESGSIQDLFSVEKTVLLLLLASFFLCFGWSMYFEFIPVWWIRRFGMSASDVGGYFSWGALWYAISCTFLVGFLLKRFRAQLLFEKASLLLALFILSVFFITVPSLFFLLLPLQNIFAAFLFPLSALIISERASSEDRGRIMGLQASAEALGFGLSPCLAGPLLGVHLLIPTVVAIVCLSLASILMRSIRRSGERVEIRSIS